MPRFAKTISFLLPRALSTLCLILPLLCNQATAAPLPFGTRTLEISAPDGFVGISKEAPDIFSLLQGFVPEGNRVAEMYVTSADKAALASGGSPEMSRYFQLQVKRHLDGKRVSRQEFSELIEQLDRQLTKDSPRLEAELQSEVDDKTEALGATIERQTGSDVEVDVAIGGIHRENIFRRASWGLFFALTADTRMEASEADLGLDQEFREYSAGALILVDGQVLGLSAVTADTGPDARLSAQRSVSEWAEAIKAANPADPR